MQIPISHVIREANSVRDNFLTATFFKVVGCQSAFRIRLARPHRRAVRCLYCNVWCPTRQLQPATVRVYALVSQGNARENFLTTHSD